MKKLFEIVNKLALDEIEKYGGPTPVHYMQSLVEGERIAKLCGGGIELVKIGVCLMDIKLGECMHEGVPTEHVKRSTEYAKKILEENHVDEKTKEILLNCVEAHHKHVPYKSLEAEICANADCYRFIHPQGVFTFILTVAKRNGVDHNKAIDMVLAKLEEKHNILSLDCCKAELEPHYQSIKKFLKESRI